MCRVEKPACPSTSSAIKSAAAGADNGPDELIWLGVLYGIVPTAVFVIAFYLCATWPLTDKLHTKVLRIVEKRYARQVSRAGGNT